MFELVEVLDVVVVVVVPPVSLVVVLVVPPVAPPVLVAPVPLPPVGAAPSDVSPPPPPDPPRPWGVPFAQPPATTTERETKTSQRFKSRFIGWALRGALSPISIEIAPPIVALDA